VARQWRACRWGPQDRGRADAAAAHEGRRDVPHLHLPRHPGAPTAAAVRMCAARQWAHRPRARQACGSRYRSSWARTRSRSTRSWARCTLHARRRWTARRSTTSPSRSRTTRRAWPSTTSRRPRTSHSPAPSSRRAPLPAPVRRARAPAAAAAARPDGVCSSGLTAWGRARMGARPRPPAMKMWSDNSLTLSVGAHGEEYKYSLPALYLRGMYVPRRPRWMPPRSPTAR